MAISPIANKDPAARTKLNDVITEVNARIPATNDQVLAGEDGVVYVSPERLHIWWSNFQATDGQVINGTAVARWADPEQIKGLVDTRTPVIAGAMGDTDRPGLNLLGYTSAATGGENAGVAPGSAGSNPRGAVERITGDGRSAKRRLYPVLQGLAWSARVHLTRNTNPSDPVGDSVQVQIHWLDSSGALLDTTRAWPASASTPLRVADGAQAIAFTFGHSGCDFNRPSSSATDAVIAVRTFGSDGVTDVEVVHIEPATGQFALDRVSPLEVAEVGYYAIDPAVAEIGDSVTPTLTWTITGTAEIASQVIRLTSIATTARTFTEPSAVSGTTIYTLRVTDHLGREKTAQLSCVFMRRMYWGVSASETLNSAGVTGLLHSGLSDELALLADLSPDDQYIYVAVPRDLYDDNLPSEIRIDGHDETANMVVTLVSVTGLATSNYRVLRSLYKLTGTNIQIEVIP